MSLQPVTDWPLVESSMDAWREWSSDMTYQSIAISSGHAKYVRGASGVLDEVDEARRVVEQVAVELRKRGVEVFTFHDDVSTTQSENLDRIVDWHNAQVRDLDVSVHFNAYVETTKAMGVEVLYSTQKDLAAQVSAAISWCGFLDRGAKHRTDLAFLNGTARPAILIETCFVDSTADAEIYLEQFELICKAMAGSPFQDYELPEMPPSSTVHLDGPVSWFGGPADKGVSPDEGLAFIFDVMDAPHLFLPYQPEGTTGLARRLNPNIHYIACRWDYSKTPHSMLLSEMALVRAGDVELLAFPADWGPHVDTGRVADISPGLMQDLGISTDDDVEVVFPYQRD